MGGGMIVLKDDDASYVKSMRKKHILELFLYYGEMTDYQAQLAWMTFWEVHGGEAKKYRMPDLSWAPCKFQPLEKSTYMGDELVSKATSTLDETSHWLEYESYDDYIVAFGSRYLPSWDQNTESEALATKLYTVMQAGNM